ncbi:nuclear condensing complex subunit [Crucibulum laeve]|uniref:Nuclear condensing complex subunit n=1 Tax=Crucibulum laeve TaxID=68775 RepID=A0A5C3LYA0_9AGAR|nr:nuclear condensing complex subunit [Crucibulum laeve]
MPGRVSQAADSPLTLLRAAIPKIFDQAQVSANNHQKNFVALYKLHIEGSKHTELVRNGQGVRLVGEKTFEEVLNRLLLLVLPLKKGTSQADRILKFVGGYTKFVNEKAAEEKSAQEGDDEDEDTTASRFTAHLLKFLLKGFESKDKIVRYRVLQTVAEMVSHLGEIDEDIYTSLRAALMDRVSDKEASVRVQAVIGLSKLCGSEDPAEVEEGETVLDVLLDTLAHDTAPDVRRAILMNLTPNATTLPHILARTRDTDPTIRKVVYGTVLKDNLMQGEEEKTMGPTHPRALTILQREQIIRNGLGDREPSVRAAASALLGLWADIVAMKSEEDQDQEDVSVERGVLNLLELLDVGVSTVAADALLSIFTSRVDIFENIEFGDRFWTSLTPETAFLARVFVGHCKAINDDVRLESTLPVVTALAFRIQESYNDLLDDIRDHDDQILLGGLTEDERNQKEDELLDREFVLAEILRLAVNLDYADEIGRRKMFQLVRDMLSKGELSEKLIPCCLDVLRKLSSNERDLIRVVVEIVHDLRDPDEEDEEDPIDDAETSYSATPATVKPQRMGLFTKPPAERTPEEAARAKTIDLKCLTLCIGMLERVNSTFEENSTLDGVLQDLVIPAVQSKDLDMRSKGFVCLGLCCLIARRLAIGSVGLFMSQIKSSPDELKLELIKTVFDTLMVHEQAFTKQGIDLGPVTESLVNLIGTEADEKVQALLCMGVSKLVFNGMITDNRALKNLIMAYLSPNTVSNQELRQCLTYFLPAFSYSASSHQKKMCEIFLSTFSQISDVRRKLEDDQEMVSGLQVGMMFVDWTDPLKLSKAADAQGHISDSNGVNDFIQLEMATNIMMALLKPENKDEDDMKILVQLLSKLYIPDKVDDDSIRTLKLLLHNYSMRRPLSDATSNRAFTKFDTAISERFAKQLEDFSEEEYKQLVELKDIAEFLDDLIPLDDSEIIDIEPKKKGRKRYVASDSIISTTTEGDCSDSPPSSKQGKKPKSKKRRLSTSDDEDPEEDDTQKGSPAPPKRTLPKRAAVINKKPPQVIVISSDDDDDDEENTPGPRQKRLALSPRYQTNVKKEEKPDQEINDMLDDDSSELSEPPHDSIMDPDSDEEQDEVNDLLTED